MAGGYRTGIRAAESQIRSMDSFLQSVSQDGRHDSTGTFTVDLAKARSKLSRYQLARFSDFPKFLTPAAVTSNTTELRFQIESIDRSKRRRTRVSFRGWSLDLEGMLTLLYQELSSPELQPQKYLAMVLSALSSKEPVVLSSTFEGVTNAFELHGDKISELKDQSVGSEDCVQLLFSCDWNAELFAHSSLRSCWIPTAVTLDGNRLNPPVGPQTFPYRRIRGFWSRGPQSPLVEFPDASVAEYPTPAGESPSLILFVEPSKADFKLIVDGMAHDLPESMRLPHVSGFLVAPELRTDLSFASLVQNRALEEIGPKLEALVVEALHLLANETKPLSREVAGSLWPLVERLRASHDMSAVEKGLLAKLGGLAPTIDPETLKVLARRIESDPPAQHSLFREYRATAQDLWKNHSAKVASGWVAAHATLRESIGLPAHKERNLTELLGLCYSHVAKLSQANPWQPYASALNEWVLTGSEEALRQAAVHPSWLLPIALTKHLQGGPLEERTLYPEGIPEWLTLWGLIHRGELEQTRTILERSPLFEWEGRRRDWLEVLCRSTSGRVSLMQSVKLRATLSLEQFKTPTSTLPQGKGFEARESSRRFNARGGNWPLFFWLLLDLERTGTANDRSSRALWKGLIIDIAIAFEFSTESERQFWLEPLELSIGS